MYYSFLTIRSNTEYPQEIMRHVSKFLSIKSNFVFFPLLFAQKKKKINDPNGIFILFSIHLHSSVYFIIVNALFLIQINCNDYTARNNLIYFWKFWIADDIYDLWIIVFTLSPSKDIGNCILIAIYWLKNGVMNKQEKMYNFSSSISE